jgi:hypothetical protein
MASVQVIDEVKHLHAALVAMRRACSALARAGRSTVLVDARSVHRVTKCLRTHSTRATVLIQHRRCVDHCETERDRMMAGARRRIIRDRDSRRTRVTAPASYRDALLKLGPSAIHRMSFSAIHELRGEFSALFYMLKIKLEAARARVSYSLRWRTGATSATSRASERGIQKAASTHRPALETHRLTSRR